MAEWTTASKAIRELGILKRASKRKHLLSAALGRKIITRKDRNMAREGTITYRNTDGSFRKTQQLRQAEPQRPDPIGVAFFARFLLKYQEQFAEERTEMQE